MVGEVGELGKCEKDKKLKLITSDPTETGQAEPSKSDRIRF